jgi:ferredoxin-thioredoxin reductase catalytic chain
LSQPLTIEKVRKRAESDAKSNGIYLNPQPDILQMLLEGLKTNEGRYGYPVCPCRLGTGNLEFDLDIICPCDYRDPDVAQYGACYCRLYVNRDAFESKNLPEVPERRPSEKMERSYGTAMPATKETVNASQLPQSHQTKPPQVKKKLWYCKQCGYVVYREDPPYVCPICKAKRDLFREIDANVEFNG